MPIATAIVATSSKHETATADFSLRIAVKPPLGPCRYVRRRPQECSLEFLKNCALEMRIVSPSIGGALEITCGERWQAQSDGPRFPVPRYRFGLDSAAVSRAAAPVIAGVRVQNFAVVAGAGNSYSIFIANYGREVAYHDDGIVLISRAPLKCDHAVLGVVGFDPLDARPFEIQLVHARFLEVQAVQVRH